MFNKGNMSNMLKQAQQVQKQIEDVQNELDDLNINGESGGGMVKATVNGKMELLNLDLQNEIFDHNVRMLPDLMSVRTIAYNDPKAQP